MLMVKSQITVFLFHFGENGPFHLSDQRCNMQDLHVQWPMCENSLMSQAALFTWQIDYYYSSSQMQNSVHLIKSIVASLTWDCGNEKSSLSKICNTSSGALNVLAANLTFFLCFFHWMCFVFSSFAEEKPSSCCTLFMLYELPFDFLKLAFLLW